MTKLRCLPAVVGLGLLSACATAPTAVSTATSLSASQLAGVPALIADIDAEGASVNFSVKPLGISPVEGTFGMFRARLEIEDAVAGRAAISATVETASIQLDNAQYAQMVKGPGWFDVDVHPNAEFQGMLSGWGEAGLGIVSGEMTIRGVTNPETMVLRLTCAPDVPCPGDQVDFDGTITVDRTAYGMTRLRGIVSKDVVLSVKGQLAFD